MLDRLYDWLANIWVKAIKDESQVLVMLVLWFRSPCWVCTAWRAMFVGAGVGAWVCALFAGSTGMALFGSACIALVGVLVAIERRLVKA